MDILTFFPAGLRPAFLMHYVIKYPADFFKSLILQQIGDTFSFKIATGKNSIPGAEFLSHLISQNRLNFLRRKHIILSLHAIAVRVLPAEETAVFIRQLPFHIL